MSTVVFGKYSAEGSLIESIKGNYLLVDAQMVKVFHQDAQGEDTLVGVFLLDKGQSVQRTDLKT